MFMTAEAAGSALRSRLGVGRPTPLCHARRISLRSRVITRSGTVHVARSLASPDDDRRPGPSWRGTDRNAGYPMSDVTPPPEDDQPSGSPGQPGLGIPPPPVSTGSTS